MSNPTLPEPVQRFVEAVNRGDTEAFLDFFPENGVVNDWGRRFVGHDAIRGWSDGEFIGAEGTMTPQHVTVDGNEVDVTAGWVSNHHTGGSRFVFVVEGEERRSRKCASRARRLRPLTFRWMFEGGGEQGAQAAAFDLFSGRAFYTVHDVGNGSVFEVPCLLHVPALRSG